MEATSVLLLFLVGSLLTYMVGNRWASKTALLVGLATVGSSVYILMQYQKGALLSLTHYSWIPNPKIAFALQVDGLSVAMLFMTTSLVVIILISSLGRVIQNARTFYSLILFMAFAMTGTFLAADGVLYYIFWELSLIPIYFISLVWGNGDANDRKKAVVKFFIYTMAGSLFMLVAFAYLYTKAGSFLLSDLTSVVLTHNQQLLVFSAFFLAYAIKIPLIPFHSWQAALYKKSPTVGTMLLAGIMLKMGLYSILRWQLPIAPFVAKTYITPLIIIGIIGTIYGSIIAIRQSNLKKLLAYSSLAHVGLIASGIYSLTTDGLRGAVIQMIAHGFAIVGLFFVADIIHNRWQTGNIDQMGGIRSQAPKLSSFFIILVLASIALPTTFGFVGEYLILFGLYQIGIGYAIAGATTIILAAYYMLRMYQNTILGQTSARLFEDITFTEGLTLTLIAFALFFFGMYPKPIINLIAPSIENILLQVNRFN